MRAVILSIDPSARAADAVTTTYTLQVRAAAAAGLSKFQHAKRRKNECKI